MPSSAERKRRRELRRKTAFQATRRRAASALRAGENEFLGELSGGEAVLHEIAAAAGVALVRRGCGNGRLMAAWTFERHDDSDLTEQQNEYIVRCLRAGKVLSME